MNLIAQHLADVGLTQRELAERVGVSQPTVSDWVNGEKIPTGDNVPRLAAALGVRPSELLASFYDDTAA